MISILKIIRTLLTTILTIVMVVTTLLIMDVYNNNNNLQKLSTGDLDYISTCIIIPLLLLILLFYGMEKILGERKQEREGLNPKSTTSEENTEYRFIY